MHRLLVALLLVSGCAFGIDGPDPARPRSQPPQCDTGKGAVVLDGLMAGIAGVVALTLVEEEPAVALVPLGIGALYAGGAASGNRNANKCRAARADHESYLAAREMLDDSQRARAVTGPPPPAAKPASPIVPAHGTAAVPPGSSIAPMPPAPVPVAPPRPAPKPEPRAAPEDADGGEWSAFWREVP